MQQFATEYKSKAAQKKSREERRKNRDEERRRLKTKIVKLLKEKAIWFIVLIINYQAPHSWGFLFMRRFVY